jgi:hypothetical protein
LVFGSLFLIFGIVYGAIHWYESIETGIAEPTGVVVLAAVTFLLGVYLLISFLNFDIQNQPENPLHEDL